MKNYISNFLLDFDFPRESSDLLIKEFEKLENFPSALEAFNKIFEIYAADSSCDYSLLNSLAQTASEKSGIHKYTVDLLMLISLSKPAKEHFIKKNIDLAIWRESMLDIKYKMIECQLVKSVCGTSCAGWQFGFYNFKMFGLGRLQFEIAESSHPYESDGKSIKAGDRTLHVHIPRTGTPLDRAECLSAYKKAIEFFAPHFTEVPMTFSCHSWLLCDTTRTFLSEKSNIFIFISDFDVINSHYPEGDDYSEIWRLFDTDYSGNLNDLPEDSSLRRAYKKHLIEGGKFGTGYGIFFADKIL